VDPTTQEKGYPADDHCGSEGLVETEEPQPQGNAILTRQYDSEIQP
jgi:hypothetical protein